MIGKRGRLKKGWRKGRALNTRQIQIDLHPDLFAGVMAELGKVPLDSIEARLMNDGRGAIGPMCRRLIWEALTARGGEIDEAVLIPRAAGRPKKGRTKGPAGPEAG
jgi:hypothetical protein